MQERRKNILITGANRGIGLGLANKFLAHGHHVIATARNPDGARDLWDLEHAYPGSFRILELDVTNTSGLQHLKAATAGQVVDILINNAGYLSNPGSGFVGLTPDELHKSFAINATGPILVTQSLLTNLQAAAQPIVVAISSKMGSIADYCSGGYYAYRMSKAALNMFVRSFAGDYPDITAVTLHPGWVKTEMGGAAAPTTVEESASGLFEVITKLNPVDSGRFIDFLGASVDW